MSTNIQNSSAEQDLENTIASQTEPKEYVKPVYSDTLQNLSIEQSINHNFIKDRTKTRKWGKLIMYLGYCIMAYNVIYAIISFIRLIYFIFNERDDVIINENDDNPKHVFHKWQMIVGPWSETVNKSLGFIQGYFMVEASKNVVK